MQALLVCQAQSCAGLECLTKCTCSELLSAIAAPCLGDIFLQNIAPSSGSYTFLPPLLRFSLHCGGDAAISPKAEHATVRSYLVNHWQLQSKAFLLEPGAALSPDGAWGLLLFPHALWVSPFHLRKRSHGFCVLVAGILSHRFVYLVACMGFSFRFKSNNSIVFIHIYTILFFHLSVDIFIDSTF